MEILFVAGLPRSGTTMIQNILDSHPNIYGGPEFDRIPNIVDLRRKLLSSIDAGRIDVYLSRQQLDEHISTLVKNFLINVKTSKELKFVSEKTPWNILVFKDLIELFPHSKFIHVLRNPLDVFESMKKVAQRALAKNVVPPDFTRDVNIAISYMLTVYKVMDTLETSNSPNLITIKYEDFLIDLESQTRRICKFLNVPWESSLLSFNSIEHPGEEQMVKSEVWYSKEMFNQNPRNRTKFERLMSTLEENLIRTVLHQNRYLRKHQYSIDLPERLLQRQIARTLVFYYRRKGLYKGKPMRVLN